MPFEITKKGNQFFVENKMTGKVLGHHDSVKKAKAQIEAINENEFAVKKDLEDASSMHINTEDGQVPMPQVMLKKMKK